VRITDFGLSKLIESEVPEGKAVGTPAYMPPEQFRGSKIGPESDWYGIGCLIYEMLTGRMLFTGDRWMEMYNEKISCEPNEQWPKLDCSEELKGIVRSALAPRPEDRRLNLPMIAEWADDVSGLFH